MWISDAKFQLLADIAYLERGLAIGTGQAPGRWDEDSRPGDRIRIDLGRLTYHEARKAKRKFRKLHRKIKKEKIKKAETLRYRSGFTEQGFSVPPQGSSLAVDSETNVCRDYAQNNHKKRAWYSGRCGRDRAVNAYLQMFDNSYGEKGHAPNKAQSRARRRDVDYYLKGKI